MWMLEGKGLIDSTAKIMWLLQNPGGLVKSFPVDDSQRVLKLRFVNSKDLYRSRIGSFGYFGMVFLCFVGGDLIRRYSVI